MKIKVAYNATYGGFAISQEAATWLADRLHPPSVELLRYFCEKEAAEPEGYSWHGYINCVRHDPLLVLAIEELGPRASARGSQILLKEISGNRYRIQEYDGMETVVEPKDLQWIEV